MPDQPVVPAEASDGLALAMIASSETPLLLLRGDMGVIAASRSLCGIGKGEWDVTQLRALLPSPLKGGLPVPSYAMELVREERDIRHLMIIARKLVYSDAGNSRLLVAVSDVTDALAALQ